ncbi:MAG: hypothetical protein KDH88_08290 [Chromatiales bacterium]|nr:hypothetical protein [Chromatiales bacterium]
MIDSIRTSLATFLATVALLLSAPGLASETVSFYVPVSADRNPVLSSMSVDLVVQRYMEPLASFAGKAEDEYEKTFAGVMEAVASGDYDAAGTLLGQGGKVGQKSLVDGLRKSFPTLGRSKVLYQVFLDGRRMFVWETNLRVKGSSHLWRRAFVLEPGEGGIRADLVSSSRPLEAFILAVLQEASEVTAGKSRGAYGLSLSPPDQPISQLTPVLRFAGRWYGGATMEEASRDGSRAMADYALAFTRLRAGDNAGYLARFTPYSQAKMKNWLAKMPPEVLADYQTGNPSRKIYFRLDAEPVDIVFYQLIDAQGNAIEDTVRWDYLLHDGGAGYLLTNAYAQSQLDDVLAMTGRFEKGMVEFVRSFGP